MAEVTKEEIDRFLAGTDPMEHIIKIECDYENDKVFIIYNTKKGEKKVRRENFHPFLWCKKSAARKLFGGNKNMIINEMGRYGISVTSLRTKNTKNFSPKRMIDGFTLIFYANMPMSFDKFLNFFKEGGNPVFGGKNKSPQQEYITVSPSEQYMIYTGKRLFKGYDDYDALVRMQWDLETEGLDPSVHAISQIGIRTNKGFEKIIPVEGNGKEKEKNEILAIREFLVTINSIKPDVISGHNSENFDWNFIDARLSRTGSSLQKFSQNILPRGVFKKKEQSVLKLGGEIEYYCPTIMWGYNITDSLFAVRRAQALDSNMKKADLKYVTRYSKLVKPNRVYVPGKSINKTWEDTSRSYAFNDNDGEWFKITNDKMDSVLQNENGENESRYIRTDETLVDKKTGKKYDIVTGKYIVERYLLDDLYETDRVECRYNQSNFLVNKMLPVSFEKMCTMGTAAIWKYIMLAWSYEHGLAIPNLIQSRTFTGGLSRLLKVGYVDNVVKLDYNSLYPSIILSFNIKTDIDLQGVMNALLEYILSQREHYKALKAKEEEKAKDAKKKLKASTDTDERKGLLMEQSSHEALASRYDKMQLPLKIIGNGFFGSYGSGNIFPWSDIKCAEETTCTGRMLLRMMIKHFTSLGYTPIVGDSFTKDTPIFIKYNFSGLIDIVPVETAFNGNMAKKDLLGREYDVSKKDFKVLCESGWEEPSYIYRHKTSKDIYQVSCDENNVLNEITENHSLYDKNGKKISPSEINNDTKLKFYDSEIVSNIFNMSQKIDKIINMLKNDKSLKKLPIEWINADMESKKLFSRHVENITVENPTKTLMAGINYIKKCVKNHNSNA